MSAKKWHPTTTALALAFLLGACPGLRDRLTLPAPTGPLGVGTVTVAMTDRLRGELLTEDPGDLRELMVQVWYPTDELPVEPAPYGNLAFGAIMSGIYGLDGGFEEDVETYASSNAPISDQEARFPVIIFSHGLGTSREVHSTTLQELASHGYVVAAINHTYGAAVTVFPDGRQFLFAALGPMRPPDEAPPEELEEFEEEKDAFFDALSNTWAEDIRFVLDRLSGWNGPNSGNAFSERLDLERVGAAGHSFGGAAATLATLHDERFLAAANLDGTFWSDVRETPLERPLLLVSTPSVFETDGTRPFVWDNLQSGGIRLEIEGAGHLSYTDLGVLVRAFDNDNETETKGILGFGDGDPLRILDVTDAYLRAYFDFHLRDIASPLLEGGSEEYPDVFVTVK